MVEVPRRIPLGGPAFVRLVAGLAGAEPALPAQPLSDRLSQWLDWTHAVALSTALDGRPPAAASDTPAAADADAQACARVRAALSKAIAGDRAFAATEPPEPARLPAAEATTAVLDAAFFSQRYRALQQAMTAAIGDLRASLREALARGSAALARLAAVDAVMEQALGPRERRLLAAVPALLGQHFERLRQTAAPDPAAGADEAATVAPCPWLDVFRRDMQNLLLAELDVRLQPAEGLLAALRAH